MSFIAPALSAAFILYDSITSKKEGYDLGVEIIEGQAYFHPSDLGMGEPPSKAQIARCRKAAEARANGLLALAKGVDENGKGKGDEGQLLSKAFSTEFVLQDPIGSYYTSIEAFVEYAKAFEIHKAEVTKIFCTGDPNRFSCTTQIGIKGVSFSSISFKIPYNTHFFW